MEVTSITLRAAGTGNALPYSNFTAAIFVDGTQVGSAKVLAGGSASFNNLTVIPASGEEEFTVVIDTIEASAPGTLKVSAVGVAVNNMTTNASVPVLKGVTPVSQSNPLTGATFELIGTVTLSVSTVHTVYSADVLVAN